MKNKKNLYILLPVVLLIWGAVLYQFFLFSDHVEMTETPQKYTVNRIIIRKKDTVTLNVNYRDPFLGKMYNTVAKKPVKNKKKAIEKKAEPLLWPTIIYKGIVSDAKDSKSIFMLIINGRTFLMKKGDIESEIRLLGGNTESIEVKYKTDKNVIPLKR